MERSQGKHPILGFAFKANTNDTRESAAIKICKDLLEEGAILNIHDPKVDPIQISKDLEISPSLQKDEGRNNLEGAWLHFKNYQDTFKNSDAAIFLTEWDDYKKINWQQVSKVMRKPAWILMQDQFSCPKN